MLNFIKMTVILLTVTLLAFSSKISYAWDGQSGRDAGRRHHEHGFHAHINPGLTLVTGMDAIDSRVLVDADPAPEEVDQQLPEIMAVTPAQMTSSDADDNFI